LKLLIFFLIFFYFPLAHAENIATFRIQYIFDNSTAFAEFQNKLTQYKNKLLDELKKEENLLISQKNDIEESKLILSEDEYMNKISEFNKITESFQSKIDKYNINIQNNLDQNEQLVLNEISTIVQEIAQNQNLLLIFSDKQYYISSLDIDISDSIINELNKRNLNLKLLDN
tara:strand:- start:261 stop:776 length:516 start_codon:yes stop_codon:yes gene_type:complete